MDESTLSDRIAIFSASLSGGLGKVVVTLAHQMIRWGVEIDLVVNSVNERNERVPTGCRVFELKVSRPRDLIFKYRNYLQTERPDAVVANSWPISALAILGVRSVSRNTRLLIVEHTDLITSPGLTRKDRFLLRIFSKRIFCHADTVAAVSVGAASSLSEVSGYPLKEIKVLYNPLPRLLVSDYISKDFSLVDWWRSGELKLISIGNLFQSKNFGLLFDAVNLLSSSICVKLIIFGEGPSRPELEHKVKILGLDDSIRMPGYKEQLYPFLLEADVFVSSSNNEGFSLAILEAVSLGLPVVSTDCESGPREILENGLWGRLVPLGDPAALAKAITESRESERDVNGMMNRAKEFSPDLVASNYLEVLLPGFTSVRTA